MLQLIKIKETDINEIQSQKFILSFEDENLPEEVRLLLKKDLMDNKYKINCAEINTKAIIQFNNNYVNSIITIPQIIFKTNEELDNTLEELKNDFLEYYAKLTERVQLIPVFSFIKKEIIN